MYCVLFSFEVIALAFVVGKQWDGAGSTEETCHTGDVTQEKVTT